jgi:Rod binding domain-containing protein
MTAIGSITSAGVATPIAAPRRGENFAQELVRETASGDRQQLRGAAEQLVASSFIQPILAQLRESPFAAGPFAPGLTERQFTPLLDQHLADRIVRGANLPLVDVIVERLAGPQ